MSAATDELNRLARMTQEERRAELLRQAVGPAFDWMFKPAPQPTDEKEST